MESCYTQRCRSAAPFVVDAVASFAPRPSAGMRDRALGAIERGLRDLGGWR